MSTENPPDVATGDELDLHIRQARITSTFRGNRNSFFYFQVDLNVLQVEMCGKTCFFTYNMSYFSGWGRHA